LINLIPSLFTTSLLDALNIVQLYIFIVHRDPLHGRLCPSQWHRCKHLLSLESWPHNVGWPASSGSISQTRLLSGLLSGGRHWPPSLLEAGLQSLCGYVMRKCHGFLQLRQRSSFLDTRGWQRPLCPEHRSNNWRDTPTKPHERVAVNPHPGTDSHSTSLITYAHQQALSLYNMSSVDTPPTDNSENDRLGMTMTEDVQTHDWAKSTW